MNVMKTIAGEYTAKKASKPDARTHATKEAGINQTDRMQAAK